MWSLWLVNKT